MEIRNLKTFLRVAALQNFTRASQELGYSQSNVSVQIKQLEQEVGLPLFDRIGRAVFLTSAGEALLPYAEQIVSTSLQMETFLKSEASMGGTVRIGMVQSLYELLLEDTFINYHHRFPNVKLELTVDDTEALEDRLRHGQLDAACLIDHPLLPLDWNVWDSADVPIVVVANPSHPLVGIKSVSAEEFAQQELVLMEDSAPYSIGLREYMGKCNIRLQPFLKLQSSDTARRMIEREPFVSVLPIYTVAQSVRAGKLAILDIEGWSYSQSVQLVFQRNKVITPQIKGFLEELQYVLGGVLAERL